MKALVTGGAGFIGSHLCSALLAEGHQVVCLDNLSLGREGNISHLLRKPGFIFYKRDASVLGDLEEVFGLERPDYVFHLAANSDIQASASDPYVEYKNTYTTTFQTLSCMCRFGVKKMFFASTSAVYGDKKDVPLDEDMPGLSPISYYGAAKLGSEALINAFSYMNDMETVIFRFANVVGPGLTHGVIYDFIRKLEKNPENLQILGDGRQTKPYIDVGDLVSAIMLLKDKGSSKPSVYNVSAQGETSVSAIADIVCQEMALSQVKYSYTGGRGGWKGDVPEFRYSTDKINKMGWRARYTSDEAVREAVKNNVNR